VPGGYALVVLLDCNRLLGKDTLKSTEAALQSWSNATAMLASGGTCVAVGMPDSLAKPFATWSQIELAQRELQTRRELGFPPALRMASVSGPRKLLDDLLVGSDPTDDSPERLPIVDKLGPVAIDAENVRYLLRYEYSAGAELSKILKSRTLQTTAASTVTSAKTGRVSRSVRVKMDDAEVI
jgi:primosomal protein N' (replication factor Y)